MPTIPDVRTLGPEPTPTPQRGVYGAQTGQIEQAGLEQDQVVGKTATEVGALAADREEAFTKLQTSQAASHLLMARANAINEANQNPDYNSISQKYSDTMAAALPNISANIQNNKARAVFEANAQEHIVDGQLNHIDHIVQTKRLDAGKASVIKSFNDGVQTAAAADPASVDGLIFGQKQITQKAYDAGLITAVEKEDQDNKFPQEVAKAQLLKQIESDPAGAVKTLRGSITGTGTQPAIQAAAAANPGVSADYLSRTAQLESSGNPNASNGKSKGLMGFMPDTAKQYGITDPTDQQQAINGAAALAKNNSADLTKSLGHAPSDSELYLAHQQGAAGAAALLKNPDEKAVDALTDVYGDKAKATAAITGNGGSADMTAKQFSDMWAKKYDAAGTGGNGLVNRIPITERETLLKMAESKMHEGQEMNGFNVALQINDAYNSGDASKLPSLVGIKNDVESGRLSAAHGLSLIEHTQKTAQDIQENTNASNAVKAALATGQPIDLKDKNQMWAADSLYQSLASSNAQRNPEEQNTAKAMFASQIGAIPASMSSEIERGLRSKDVSAVTQSISLIDKLRSADPKLLDGFKDPDLRFANTVQAKIQSGYPPADAINKATEALQIPPSQMDGRKKDYELQTDPKGSNTTASWLAGKLPGSVDPVMAHEFDQNAMQEYQATGDLEGARKTALDQLQRVWGQTSVGGPDRWMKYAPEKFYGVTGPSPGLWERMTGFIPNMIDGNRRVPDSEWMNQQLVEDVGKDGMFDHPLSAKDIIVTPNPAGLTSDGKPTYLLALKNKDGVLQNVTNSDGKPKVWIPSWLDSQAYKDQQSHIQASIDAARAKRAGQ